MLQGGRRNAQKKPDTWKSVKRTGVLVPFEPPMLAQYRLLLAIPGDEKRRTVVGQPSTNAKQVDCNKDTIQEI